ncbi:MAG: alpha-N-acetylglucosaminidase TIM-barrel domain-containing protein [Clostridiaceae bacterium]
MKSAPERSPVKKIKIIKPAFCQKVYDIAAEEFQRLYCEVTGIKPPVVTEDDRESDLVVIGSDAVNSFSADLIFEKKFEGFDLRYGTDDYNIRSMGLGERSILLIAGGRGRSTLYAVYHFFEKRAGCRYFWDGDRIPNADSVNIAGLNVSESPRFEYRGVRYFAHRSLHRFQAEHWSYEDWRREIDLLLKKRLNMFMLRIGNDDIFQKAFPDVVDYPLSDRKLPEAVGGYDDRTLFWPLQYRGELRKKILDYAFERDLIHPEDCGTITHWYSRTPIQFLEKMKPKLLSQRTKYYNESTALVWDIRDDRNLENYFKLTEAHIKEYGRSGLFHTIGLAERSYSDDRDAELRLKLYVYRRIVNYLKERWPNAPLLIASWDLWMFYTADEVKKLLSELDPDQAILFDYTSDTVRESNFTNWGVVGKFPWIFGIFHAYERNSEIRGNYDLTEERLAIAKDDSFCKGLVFWPEISHSDTFMLEFFAENAWAPLTMSMDERIGKYCVNRYQSDSGAMTEVWSRFMPIVKLISWSMENTGRNVNECFIDIFRFPLWDEMDPSAFERILDNAAKNVGNAVNVLETLASLDNITKDKFLRRDVFDIARTICGRYLNLGIALIQKLVCQWRNSMDTAGAVFKACGGCTRLMELLAELLS